MLELGGQWVSPDQTALLATLEELGLDTYSRYREGDSVYVDAEGVRTRFTGDIFPVAESTAAEIERLITLLDELVAEVGVDCAVGARPGEGVDRISWSAWLAEQTDDVEARDNIALFIAAAMLTKPSHSFSLLQALLMAASAGSFTHLVEADFILDKRVVGGLQQVPIKLAEALGDDVHLSSPVRRLEWSDAGVSAEADSVTVNARYAIVAVPPNLYSRIDFQPPLPRLSHQMHQHISLGLVIKVHAVYETPFWREDGLSGTAFSPYELVHEAYDNTNHEDPRGTLVGFVSDERADEVFKLSAEERRERILDLAVPLLRRAGPLPRRLLRERLGQRGVDAGRVRGELRPRRALTLRRHAVDAGRSDLLVDERPRRRGLPARRRRDPQGRRHRGGDHRPPPGVASPGS